MIRDLSSMHEVRDLNFIVANIPQKQYLLDKLYMIIIFLIISLTIRIMFFKIHLSQVF